MLLIKNFPNSYFNCKIIAKNISGRFLGRYHKKGAREAAKPEKGKKLYVRTSTRSYYVRQEHVLPSSYITQGRHPSPHANVFPGRSNYMTKKRPGSFFFLCQKYAIF
jgi:hypothetical protein